MTREPTRPCKVKAICLRVVASETSGAVQLFTEAQNRSNVLDLPDCGRKTASHFSWNCSNAFRLGRKAGRKLAMRNHHNSRHEGMSSHPYSMLAINMILSLIIMYFVMFSMIDGWSDFRNNLNML
ncbi:hypothetical conserved protein [Rhizobium etli CFN 42]|uniref:Hypothetical conserved protein n=1 Tax=Rhizobium etli (strain ATCC 51251 / DSM 11541 / JCM 21823 / NBRC 15573 / CFN 42) TaxID=347834 RepID=Q2K4S7_RHIEC|nr:hypothetical conserved protein [Rhizobium etli CFN 42]